MAKSKDDRNNNGILSPEIEFELPYNKNDIGMYKVLPDRSHIGGRNSLRDLAASKTKIGYLYFINIVGTSKYKLGVSEKPKRRLSDISNYIPFDLDILAINKVKDPYKLEQQIINNYKCKLIKNEWFDFSINEAKEIMILLHNRQVKDFVYGKK